MTALSFTIPGRIGGKGRGRAFLRHGHIAVVTPKKTRVDEGIVRHFAREAMRVHRMHTPFEDALRLRVHVWLTPPKSWSKKKQAQTVYVTGKPDCDNVLKLIADAMNNIVWRDDSQISEIIFSRQYRIGVPDDIDVTVEPLLHFFATGDE